LKYGIPPSEYNEEEILKVVDEMVEKRGLRRKPVEFLSRRRVVWMPYYRIEFKYSRSQENLAEKSSETAPRQTALNAMFCGCAKDESEFLMLFRPNYLKHETMSFFPQKDEFVGLASCVDVERILSGLMQKMNEAQDELSSLRSDLSKRYVRKRRYSMIFPMLGVLRQERDLSEKIAKLSALRNTIGMCLNLDEEAGSIDVLRYDTFYYPTLVAELRQQKNESERFLVVNLVKRGSIRARLNCDIGLTQLCNKNDECKMIVAAAVVST